MSYNRVASEAARQSNSTAGAQTRRVRGGRLRSPPGPGLTARALFLLSHHHADSFSLASTCPSSSTAPPFNCAEPSISIQCLAVEGDIARWR